MQRREVFLYSLIVSIIGVFILCTFYLRPQTSVVILLLLIIFFGFFGGPPNEGSGEVLIELKDKFRILFKRNDKLDNEGKAKK